MKLIAVLVTMFMVGACTSMLLDSSGKSAGSAIGHETRSGAQISADDRISTAIRSKFAADEDLQPLRLQVQTRQGAVTLRGTATTFGDRDRAVRIASDVNGVSRIDNQIKVNTN